MPQLTRNFHSDEFVAASQRGITVAELALTQTWANLLQPVRDAVGPIRITSFARDTKPGTGAKETGPHAYGWGLDVVGTGIGVRALADALWAKLGRTGKVFAVIYERDHVHLSLKGVAGATPGYLDELVEGKYTLREAAPGSSATPKPAPAPTSWTPAPAPTPAPAAGGGLIDGTRHDPGKPGAESGALVWVGVMLVVLALVVWWYFF